MPISHQHCVVFIHIPKTAGTSIEYALSMHGNVRDVGIRPHAGAQVKTELYANQQQHYMASQIRKHVGEATYSRYFSFAFVRNPWDRVVSEAAWDNGRSLREKTPLTKEKFEKYVARLQHMPLDRNPHTRPQYRYVCDASGQQIIVDFVGRFETLAQDWATLCAKLDVNLTLPTRMKSYHRDYRQYYTPETKRIVAKLYAKDIALFKYKF